MAKKVLIFIYLIITIFNLNALSNIKVEVNGSSFTGRIDDDIVYLPLTDICKKFDIKYGFFPDTNIIAINYQEQMMSTVVDQKELIVNNEINQLDNAPMLINDEVYMPVSFFSKYMGLDISWEPEEIRHESKISQLIFRESTGRLEIFIKADKSFSKNEYFIIQEKKQLVLSFPNTTIEVAEYDYPEDYIDDIRIINEQDKNSQLIIDFNNIPKIEAGPAVKLPGMYIRTDISNVQKELPENRDIFDTVEIALDNDTVGSDRNTPLPGMASNTKISSESSEVKTDVYRDSQEIFDVEDSYLEKVSDLELQQYTFIEETKENVLENRVIVIDPGHGGSDYGITKYGIYEKDIVLSLSRRLFNKLSQSDASVFMTRKGNEELNHEKRVYVANSQKGELFISIHLAYSVNPMIRGFSVYYYDKEKDHSFDNKADAQDLNALKRMKVYDDSVKFSRLLSRHFVDELGFIERNIFKAPVSVLKDLNCPAILLEVNHLSNMEMAELMKEDEIQEKITESIFNSIETFFMRKRYR